MIIDLDFALRIIPDLTKAARITVFLTVVPFLISLGGGLILLLFRRSRNSVVSSSMAFFINFIRGTPLLVQVFLIYYIGPVYGLTLGVVETGVLAFSIHYSCYMAETYRSALEAIPRGQWEAAKALGLPQIVSFYKVILPQMIPFVTPIAGSYLVYMFKDTPLLSAITVRELLQVASKISAENFRYIEPLTIVGILFLVMSMLASFMFRFIERRVKIRWHHI